MGKRLVLILFLLAAALGAEAQNYAVNGACTLGGQATVTQGMASSGTRPLRGSATFNGTGVMASYPGCTVTVFLTGTLVPAQIYLTASGNPQSNPFTADLNDGSWVFFAAAACYDIRISSGASQASTMPNSKTFPGVCAGAGSGGGGTTVAGTQVTVNGTAAVPNALNFSNVLLPPANGTVINFLLNGNNVGAYLAGNGNASNCLSGTGTWVACSGGGGGTLPSTSQFDLFASTGSGGAQASGLQGNAGFMKGQVFLATGDVTSASPAFPLAPNSSVEYFPTGATFGGISIGATNGLAAYFSHSGRTAAGPGYGNGGLMLGGGNSSGTNYQIYVDCESAPALGCDFKVPITINGSAVGGGGLLPTIPAPHLFASNGSGSAVDSGVLGQSGFFRAYVLEATGTGTASPFSVPNGSIEYFPTGGYGAGGANGVALHVSHSGSATGFGGIALAGGNTSGSDQLYLDCEGPPVVPALGCDFKVPITINGAAVGGGGGGGGVNPAIVGQFANYNTTTTVSGSHSLSDNGTQITSTEPIAAPQFITTTPSTGVSMTGTGGTLPVLASGTGGLGIGPGAVPMMNLGTGAGWIAIPSSAGAAGVASINGVGGAFNFTGAVTCTSTTCDFTGGGTGSTTNPIVFPSGTALTQLASGNGGLGVNSAGLAAFASSGASPTGTNGNWYPISVVQVNGVVPTVALANFNSTTPTAPANGRNVIWNRNNSGAYSAALVGDGTTNCLNGQGLYVACGAGGGGSGTVASGALGHLAWYSTAGTTVSSNANLDDGQTTPATITSQETIAAPGINVTGSGGIAMTGAGGSLPAPVASSGGIGIGPGNVPEYYSNGGPWTAIGSGGGGGGTTVSVNGSSQGSALNLTNGSVITWTGATGTATPTITGTGSLTDCLLGTGAFGACPSGGGTGIVNSGTAGQFAWYSTTGAAVSGSTALTSNGTVITSTEPISMATTTPVDFQFPNFSATAPTPVSGLPQLSVYGSGGTAGAGFYVSSGSTSGGSNTFQRLATAPTVNSTQMTTQSVSFSGTAPNTCTATNFPTNGRCIVFYTAGPNTGTIGAALVGDGSANCLSGTGTYVTCAGGTAPVTCMPSTDLLTFTTRTNVCTLTLPAGARQWIVQCNLIWNMQTGGSGATTITSRLNLSTAPTAASYFTTETWAGGGPTFGNINVLAQTGDSVFNTTATSNTDLTIWSYVYRGTIMVPAAGETAIFSLQSSVGTGALRLGSYCKAE